MPALRRNRQSRTSTPLAAPNESQSSSSKEKVQTTLDGWKEPAPQNPQPSSEEHGSARNGLLENMAPLGSLPSARVRQGVRNFGEAVARTSSSFFGRNGGASGEEAASTPEVTPAPEVDQEDSEMQDEEEAHASYDKQEEEQEEEDDDYTPSKTKKNVKTAKSAKGKSPVQTKAQARSKTPVKNGTRRASTVPPSPAMPNGPPTFHDEEEQRMQIAVNDAISRCHKTDQRDLGIALKQLFDDSKIDPELADALDGVVHSKASKSQYRIFHDFIKRAKKMIRHKSKVDKLSGEAPKTREGTRSSGRRRVLSPKDSSDIAPEDSASPGNPMEDVVPTNSPSKQVDSATEEATESTTRRGSVQAPPHPLTTAPALSAAESPSEPTPRMPTKSPRKRAVTNGKRATGSKLDTNGATPKTAQTPAAKTPSSSPASDSELSEVNEEIVQKGPPESIQVNGKSTAAASAAPPKKGKNGRGGGKKPPPKPKAKPERKQPYRRASPTQPKSPEELAELAEIEKKRKEFAETQLARQVELDIPTSDLRFDDEMLETESLTESQIAVGPPVNSSRARRAGRAPRKETKRLREDDSRFSSPQLESTATTRPTTPAIYGPKRIKLNNGQAARTKRSPVKNRDGPIAGTLYTGGGGSRQLGPDDNDPNSPQSDSDDLCSACKGPGEFVCCEGCPRVFHFKCCDPPRDSVPEGSFYCHECSGKLNRAEDPTPVSALGPLFKALERTNTRAFALPAYVQNHFENVSARPDGSYSEDVKKIALSKAGGYGGQRPDYTRQIDADGKVILCAQCGLSSGGKRQMLKCDFCPLYWHLDCCDPILANPPYINPEASHRDSWRCPRHIEHDLRSGMLVQNDLNADRKDVDMLDAFPISRVMRKIRKPRVPKIVESTFARGTRNNGLIDIVNDSEDETDGEGNYVFGPEDRDLHSRVFRVPEKGLTLDFLTKVKSSRVEKRTENRKVTKSTKAAAQRVSTWQNLTARPIDQQQAAINLAQMSHQDLGLNLGENKIHALILTLTAEAPTDVVTAIADAPPPPVTEVEKTELIKLRELINRRLGG